MQPPTPNGSYDIVNNEDYFDCDQPSNNRAYTTFKSYQPNGSTYGYGVDHRTGKAYDLTDAYQGDDGKRVAQQMATGSGEYTKGKGWE